MADNFSEYLKCGDILIAPSSLYKVQYTLKCSECEEHYSSLETFLLHYTTHFKRDYLDDVVSGTVDRGTQHEEIASPKEEDPLLLLKQEQDLDMSMDEDLNYFDDIKPSEIENDIGDSIGIKDEDMFEQENDIVDSEEHQNEDMYDSENEALEPGDRVTMYSPFVVNFFKTDKKVSAFIEAYKKLPDLWNTAIFHNVSTEIEEQLQDIVNEVEEKVAIQLTNSHVITIIRRLHREYKIRLGRMENKEDNVAETSTRIRTVNYLDKLHFLKPLVQLNGITYLDPLQANLTPEQIIQILGIYERFPHLWNSNLIEYVCKNKRTEALEQLQIAMESEMELKTSQQDLEKYMHSLHTHFSREKRYNMKNLRATAGRSQYYEHMLFLLDHVAPIKCDQCNLKYQSPLSLKAHKTKHDGLLHLKCSLCPKEYKAVEPYTAHARRHMNDYRSECEECGKKFMRQADLLLHMRTHTGEKQYCCEICGLHVGYSHQLTLHRRRHLKEFTHFCQYCSKGFCSKKAMNSHITSHTNTRHYHCKICGKSFKTDANLRTHKFVHEEGRNHACKLCGKTFKNKLGIYHHMRTHRKNDTPE